MDNFPQTEDEIRDLKSMTLGRYTEIEFKHIDLTHIDVIRTIRPRPIVSKFKEFTCCVFVKRTQYH